MNDTTSIRIAHLKDFPGHLPMLEHWFIEEWTPWYGPGGAGDARADLQACNSQDALPICLVALEEGGDLLGTATLKSDSVGSELGVGPWLAAVLVSPEHRRRGVGTALVEAIEAEASRLGFEYIYTSTDSAQHIIERRGWEKIGHTQSLRGALDVYHCRMLSYVSGKRSERKE